MDGYQFTANVIASIASVLGAWAWPAVIALLLFLLRPQLGALAQRLNELTLPGGAKASFHSELEATKAQAISLTARAEGSSTIESTISIERLEPINSPSELIRKSFEEIDEFISAHIKNLPIEAKRAPADFLFYEIERKLGRKDVYDLYANLRRMHTTAMQSKPGNLRHEDAIQYIELCTIFEKIFVVAFSHWQLQRMEKIEGEPNL